MLYYRERNTSPFTKSPLLTICLPEEATVKKIAEANGLEPKQDAEHGTYYEFPLVFEREKLNNKDGKLLDWVGTNNTKISATYVDGSICIPVTGVKPTTTTFDPTVPRMEVYGEENGEKKNHKVVVVVVVLVVVPVVVVVVVTSDIFTMMLPSTYSALILVLFVPTQSRSLPSLLFSFSRSKISGNS